MSNPQNILDDMLFWHGIDISKEIALMSDEQPIIDLWHYYGDKEWTFAEFKKKYENGDFKKK